MEQLEQLLRKLIEFGLLTDDEEVLVDKSLLHIENRLHPKTGYIEFIEEYNLVRKTKYQPDIESRKLFYATEGVYTNADRLKALRNALTDPWIIQKAFPVTPQWILKPENLSKYMNYAAPAKSDSDNKGKSKTNDQDYSSPIDL